MGGRVSGSLRFFAPFLLALGASHVADAQQALSLTPLGATSIRIDGDVREWRGVHFYRVGGDVDGSFEYALGYDAQAVYVGARVHDDELVRSRNPSPAEDAVVLTLVMPRASGAPQTTEVWLYAGIMGRQKAQAAVGPGAARARLNTSVVIAEGPLDGSRGYVLEARVPWSAIAGSGDFMVGRGAIALHDVDGKVGSRATNLASAQPNRTGELPPLLVEGGANAAIATFLRDKDLASESVRYDLLGDLGGDGRLERVVLAGTFAVVAGPEIQGGNGYSFIDLPVPLISDVRDAALRDLDGDGKAELVVWLREDPAVPHAYRWDGSRFAAIPQPASAQPAPGAQAARQVANEPPRVVHLAPPGAAELVAAFRQARGIDPAQKARFVQHVNVAEDSRLESLMLFGKDLLVIGKGYRDGTGYFYFSLPVVDASDIQRVFTADVTGDGRRELFVRTKQMVGDVQREILLGYTFNDQGMAEILTLEVRRSQSGNSVGNVVELLSDRGHWALRISPGRAHGWDARTYPFVAESADAYAPLLLPWQSQPLRYHFDGRHLVVAGER